MCLCYVFQRPGYTTMQQALEGLRSSARGENRQVVGGYIIEEVIGRGNGWSRGTVKLPHSSSGWMLYHQRWHLTPNIYHYTGAFGTVFQVRSLAGDKQYAMKQLPLREVCFAI